MTLWVFLHNFTYTMFAKHIFNNNNKKEKNSKIETRQKMQPWATAPVNKGFFTLRSFFLFIIADVYISKCSQNTFFSTPHLSCWSFLFVEAPAHTSQSALIWKHISSSLSGGFVFCPDTKPWSTESQMWNDRFKNPFTRSPASSQPRGVRSCGGTLRTHYVKSFLFTQPARLRLRFPEKCWLKPPAEPHTITWRHIFHTVLFFIFYIYLLHLGRVHYF